jgi:histidine triad (HIT) family protein
MQIMRIVFPVARSWLGTRIVPWVFAHMSFALPISRLRETERLLAFYHPRPVYPVHVLIVPKKTIPSLMALSRNDADLLVEIYETVHSLVAELALEEKGYRLIANGGPYQEVAQLHFHLISETKE